MLISLRELNVRKGKSGNGTFVSSRLEFWENTFPKRQALSTAEVRISGPLIKMGMEDFPRFKILFVMFQNTFDPSVSSSILVFTDDLFDYFACLSMRLQRLLDQRKSAFVSGFLLLLYLRK